MYLIRKSNPKLSLHTIGDFFDKDHSTVVHSCKTVENDMKTDSKYKRDMEFMLDQITTQKIVVETVDKNCKQIPFFIRHKQSA